MATPGPTPTPTPGESELDTSSSINNLSSLVAEKGTVTSGTGDDDIETSSIEQLDWSEADEEELQQQELAAAAAAKGLPTRPSPKESSATALKAAADKEPELVIGGADKSGQPLSSALLESMSSTVDSNGSSKKSVIENWASGVKEAVDRGEMELEDETPENGDEEEDSDEDMTVDEGANNDGTGMRKRIKLACRKGPMSMSSISSFAVDSNMDPLSNAPVLDDGPIWKKGPKRYRFQENRRFNQKLTFGVLLAVVLAIGLGLGNLVAYNECEAEYKATQPKLEEPSRNLEHNSRSNGISKPADTFAKSNEIPSMSSLPMLKKTQTKAPGQQSLMKTSIPDLQSIPDELPADVSATTTPVPVVPPQLPLPLLKHKKEEEPSLDSKYGVHMETLTKIVQSLDNLQRKIDKFENNSRRLGGVVVLKDLETDLDSTPETIKEEPASEPLDYEKMYGDRLKAIYEQYEEEAESSVNDDQEEEDVISELDGEWMDKLIYGIEESADFARHQDKMRYYEELDRLDNERHPNPFAKVKSEKDMSDEDREFGYRLKAYYEVTRKAEEEFIREQRDELREMKILGLAEERNPEDYTAKEKAELSLKYDKYMIDYPFIQEVDKLIEQLKSGKDSEVVKENRVGQIDHDYFNDWDRAFGDDNEEELALADLKFHEFYGIPMKSDSLETSKSEEKSSRKDLQVEPRKDLVATNVEKTHNRIPGVQVPPYTPTKPEMKQDISWQDLPKGDEEEMDDKRLKSSNKEYPKRKIDKSGKHSKAPTSFDEYGSGQQYSDKKGAFERKMARNGKSKKSNDDNGSYNKQKKSEKKQRNSKEYKESKQVNDFDYDDAEHKRKRYSESNKEKFNKNNQDNNNNHRRGQKDATSNWLSERAKAREDNQNQQIGDNGNTDYHPHSSGKKVNNWQGERDRVRDKVRSKHPKNKSYFD